VKDILYARYPFKSIFAYNALTVVHFLLGAAILILGYGYWIGYLLGFVYMLFAFGEMYLLMPLIVCPNCVYYKMENSLCISGMKQHIKKNYPVGQYK
jgi:hypothetical protein